MVPTPSPKNCANRQGTTCGLRSRPSVVHLLAGDELQKKGEGTGYVTHQHAIDSVDPGRIENQTRIECKHCIGLRKSEDHRR